MKRTLFLLLAILLSANILKAQDNDESWQKKHRGLDFKVRGGYSVGIGKAEGFDMINLDASIGKRLDWMYLGIGSGAWMGTSSGTDPIIPITLDWETFITEGRITPTTLLRVGYAINTAEDIKIMGETIKQPNCLVFQAMPGIRFGLTRRVDFDLAVGMTAMTSVGGSPGTNGTSVYLSVSGALNFHKTTKPKPKKPIRESGMQVTLEGGALGFSGGEEDYKGGSCALAFTYKFNHQFSAGLGLGANIVEPWLKNGVSYLNVIDGRVTEHFGTDLTMNPVAKAFLRGQYNLTSKRFSPFVACDAGIHIYNIEDRYDFEQQKVNIVETFLGKYKSIGFYIEPAIGLSIRTTNNSYLDLKAGYSLAPAISGKTMEKSDENMYCAASRASFNVSAPFISLGFRHTFGWGSKWFK